MDPNQTCWLHPRKPQENCLTCSDAALAELRRRLSGDETPEPFVTPENRTAALRALDKAVKHARRMGLEVTCEAREVITTTL